MEIANVLLILILKQHSIVVWCDWKVECILQCYLTCKCNFWGLITAKLFYQNWWGEFGAFESLDVLNVVIVKVASISDQINFCKR